MVQSKQSGGLDDLSICGRQEQHKKEEEQHSGSERSSAWTGLALLGAGFAFSAPLLAEEVKTRKVSE